MRNVDDSLRAAAAETRDYAARQWPGTLRLPITAGRPGGWLAFAGGFALVIVIFSVVPWLLGRTGSEPEPPPLATTGTTTAPSTTLAAIPQCSATGSPVPELDETLPGPVAETGAAIIAAATSCDLEALVDLAGPGFTADFGGGDAETLRTWEEEGQGHLGDLLAILGMSHGVKDDGSGGVIYVWPSAFVYETWEEIPEEALDELRVLYTEEELDQISLLGSYGGWRVGVHESGDWLFFLAGD